jgi:hypothetical protein
MTLLQTLQRFLIAFDGGLELADILRPAFSESRLGLPIALLSLFRSGIYLKELVK